MKVNETLSIVEFLGSELDDSQALRLMDEIRVLSIADRERVLASLDGGILYTLLSEQRGELGEFERY